MTSNHIDNISIPPPTFFSSLQVIPVWFYRLKRRLLKWKMCFQ